MFCKHCGNQIDENDTFCSSCGKNLQNSEICTPQKEKQSITSIIVMWGITIFLVFIHIVMANNDGLNANNAFLAAFSMPIPAAIVSFFAFKKSKDIYRTEKTRNMQVVYAISIILLILSVLFAFGGILDALER